MQLLPNFPDAEQVVCDMLEHLADTYKYFPENAEESLPLILVTRVGGGDDGITDRARIQVAAWHEDRPKAWELAGDIRQAFLAAADTEVNGVFIDTTRTDAGGQQVPYQNPDDRRVIQTFWISMRRQRAHSGS